MIITSLKSIPATLYACDQAIGSLSIVPVLMLVAADIFLSGSPSDAIPPGDSLVLATVKVCSASSEKCAVTIFLFAVRNWSGFFLNIEKIK